jgi:hypothetical protein
LKSPFRSATSLLKKRLDQEVKVMFHVYFGAFDVVLYAIAIIGSLYIADAVSGELESDSVVQRQGNKEGLKIEETGMKGERPLILNGPIFELNGTLVVKRSDIPIGLPEVVRSYSLRGDPAIRIQDLQNIFGSVAIDARQFFTKWQQWKPRRRKKHPKKESRPLKGAAEINGGNSK